VKVGRSKTVDVLELHIVFETKLPRSGNVSDVRMD